MAVTYNKNGTCAITRNFVYSKRPRGHDTTVVSNANLTFN